MKYWILCVLIISIAKVNGQEHIKIFDIDPWATKGRIRLTRVLPIIKVDPCLGVLLKAVAKSNRKSNDSGKSVYGLNFSNRGKYKYLEIFIEDIHDAKETNYVALIEIKNATFLCYGDINNEPLFHKTLLGSRKIKLDIRKKTRPVMGPVEPSLQGTLSVCKGLPIYIEVYTPQVIAGYKMDVRHRK